MVSEAYIRECNSTLYVEIPRKQMAAHTLQCNMIIPELTNKRDLTFQNHSEVVSDDFLADLSVYFGEIMSIK